MPTIQHPDIRPVSGDPTAGPHVIHYWEVANNTARDALSLVANDIGRVCRVGSSAPYTFFVLTNNTGPVWSELGGSGGGAVDSVFGRTGVVTAQSGDYTAAQVTGAVPDSRTITAGTGLTGGGDFTANRTLAVSFGSSSTTACVGDDSRLSNSRAPTGTAGGSLAGTYPNPTVAAGVIGDTEIATAIKDPAAATAGLRTLGTSATSACAGNDSRLSDSRAPNGAASGDLGGTYPNPTVSVARGLRETAGPTNLTLGAVADGQVLVRFGSTIVGAAAGSGDVVGPSISADNRIVRMDGTTGKLIQSSPVTLGDTGQLLGASGVTVDIKGGIGTSGDPAGAVVIDAGDPDGFTAASVTIGGTHANAVTLGRSGITTSVLGNLEADVLFQRQRVALWTEDFVNGVTGVSTAQLGAGTGAGAVGAVSEEGTFGIIQLSTGTTSTGRFGVFNSSGVNSTRIDADGAVWFDAHIRIPTLSDGTETFALYVGFGNAQNAEPTQGAYFAYLSGTSANWIIKTANSSRADATTGTEVSTGWTRLSIRINAANTEARFFINGTETSGSPLTSNLPATNQALSITINLMKSVGSTARTCLVDYVAAQKFFNTPR